MNIKVPVSWLREYLKTDAAAKTIANLLSLSGPSVERLEKTGRDWIFEVEVTSNRPDAFSIFGLAREANTILNANDLKSQLIPPKGQDGSLDPDLSALLPLDVVIRDKKLCPRFTAIVIDNVQIKPSPAVIANRLKAAGTRPINNIVDIANYLMLELGQPMHTFDYDKIKNHRMILRASQEGEKITTLDGQPRKLPAGAIVIEDEGRLIDLCGIMGGANSQISRRTRRVVLFVQAYDPLAIRRATRALSFRTEAAGRFEKGVDLEGIPSALSRAVYLAKKLASAKIASELIDIYSQKPQATKITLRLGKLKQYLQVEIPSEKAVSILQSLGFVAKVTGQILEATPPSWRLADCQNDVDLIEEIARIYGYRKLPSKLPEGQIPKSRESELGKVITLKTALKYQGLSEVISYSIVSKELLELTNVSPQKVVELANPLTGEWQFMRPTILISLAQIIGQNRHLKKDLKIFEIAKTYIRQEDELPIQDLYLAVSLAGSDFYTIKGLVENVCQILSVEPSWHKPEKVDSLFDNRQSAIVKVDGQIVGTAGILNSSICDYFKIEEPVAACEINLTTIYKLPTIQPSYKSIPKYPPVIEDISAIFGLETPLAEIVKTTQTAGSPIVKKIEIIDVFTNEKIGKDKKSVTLRLNYQRSDKTPTQEEVTAIRQKISASLTKTFKAQIRK